MRVLILVVLSLAGCSEMCSTGEMRCHGNVAQMCEAENAWADFQNCGAVGLTCSTSPAACSGYTDIACCT